MFNLKCRREVSSEVYRWCLGAANTRRVWLLVREANGTQGLRTQKQEMCGMSGGKGKMQPGACSPRTRVGWAGKGYRSLDPDTEHELRVYMARG